MGYVHRRFTRLRHEPMNGGFNTDILQETFCNWLRTLELRPKVLHSVVPACCFGAAIWRVLGGGRVAGMVVLVGDGGNRTSPSFLQTPGQWSRTVLHCFTEEQRYLI